MLKKMLLTGLVTSSVLFLTGCVQQPYAHTPAGASPDPYLYASAGSESRPQQAHHHQTHHHLAPHPYEHLMHAFDPVVIRVLGYGAPSTATDAQTNPNQRRLMAMRASRMDAYRALAERVYGTRIQGSTTVQNLATRDDYVRGYVDSIVRGAKVIATRENNGVYETELELVLEPRFQHCMLRSQSIASDPLCTGHTVHGEHPSQRLPVSHAQPRQRYHLN